VLLLAFLPKFPKGNIAASTRAGFHKALTIVFEPLQKVFSTDLDLDCADGFVRFCFPRLAAWMAVTPKQNFLTSVVGGFCPVCTVPKDCMGKQTETWAVRESSHQRKRKTLSADQEEQPNDPSNDVIKHYHQQATFIKSLWPEIDPF
jgi:hypothetical protein